MAELGDTIKKGAEQAKESYEQSKIETEERQAAAAQQAENLTEETETPTDQAIRKVKEYYEEAISKVSQARYEIYDQLQFKNPLIRSMISNIMTLTASIFDKLSDEAVTKIYNCGNTNGECLQNAAQEFKTNVGFLSGTMSYWINQILRAVGPLDDESLAIVEDSIDTLMTALEIAVKEGNYRLIEAFSFCAGGILEEGENAGHSLDAVSDDMLSTLVDFYLVNPNDPDREQALLEALRIITDFKYKRELFQIFKEKTDPDTSKAFLEKAIAALAIDKNSAISILQEDLEFEVSPQDEARYAQEINAAYQELSRKGYHRYKVFPGSENAALQSLTFPQIGRAAVSFISAGTLLTQALVSLANARFNTKGMGLEGIGPFFKLALRGMYEDNPWFFGAAGWLGSRYLKGQPKELQGLEYERDLAGQIIRLRDSYPGLSDFLEPKENSPVYGAREVYVWTQELANSGGVFPKYQTPEFQDFLQNSGNQEYAKLIPHLDDRNNQPRFNFLVFLAWQEFQAIQQSDHQRAQAYRSLFTRFSKIPINDNIFMELATAIFSGKIDTGSTGIERYKYLIDLGTGVTPQDETQ